MERPVPETAREDSQVSGAACRLQPGSDVAACERLRARGREIPSWGEKGKARESSSEYCIFYFLTSRLLESAHVRREAEA